MTTHAAQGYPATRSSPPLLTAREVARLLNVSRPTVERMAARGELHRIPIGLRLYRFHPDEIARLRRDPTNAERSATTPSARAEADAPADAAA